MPPTDNVLHEGRGALFKIGQLRWLHQTLWRDAPVVEGTPQITCRQSRLSSAC